MKRLNFVLNEAGYCKIKVTDLNGQRCFFMNSEEKASVFEVDICGDRFDLTVTPIAPDLLKDLDEIEEFERNTFKGKILYKTASSLASFASDMFFYVECTYHVEDFRDGDTLNINMTVFSYPSNDFLKSPLWWLTDIWDLFPVMYMLYEVSLDSKRIEPVNTLCIDRKKTIKNVRKFIIFNSAFLETIIDYPINMMRVRYLSREKKIFSSLLKFSKMDEEKRWKYIGDKDFFENVE